MSVSLVAPSSAVARPSLRLLPRQSSDSESLEIDIADPNHVLQADFAGTNPNVFWCPLLV
jgi:hypothetical protein